MSKIKGDFLGFTFDGVHSSELGIFRVSDGSRYSENLLPTIQDKTTQVPGGDGMYYQNSFFTQRQFNLSIAFDNLDEIQLRKLKTLFGDKNIHDLIFDEYPYKIYRVKATGTPNLKYVCFEKEQEKYNRLGEYNQVIHSGDELYNNFARPSYGRIYKGEGQLSFITYSPYAISRFKYLDDYTVGNIPEWGKIDTNRAQDVYQNFYDWDVSSKLIRSERKKNIGDIEYVVDRCQENGVLVYNAGDIPTHFILKFRFDKNFKECQIGTGIKSFLLIRDFELYDGDVGFQINTKLNLLEGFDEDGNITGTIYNKYIEEGDFFKIPIGDDLLFIPFLWSQNAPNNFSAEIDYHYLYL